MDVYLVGEWRRRRKETSGLLESPIPLPRESASLPLCTRTNAGHGGAQGRRRTLRRRWKRRQAERRRPESVDRGGSRGPHRLLTRWGIDLLIYWFSLILFIVFFFLFSFSFYAQFPGTRRGKKEKEGERRRKKDYERSQCLRLLIVLLLLFLIMRICRGLHTKIYMYIYFLKKMKEYAFFISYLLFIKINI